MKILSFIGYTFINGINMNIKANNKKVPTSKVKHGRVIFLIL